MDVLNLLQELAALLFVQHEVDAHVHHELSLQNLFDLLDLRNLTKVNGHFKLLVVTAFNKALWPNECEDNHVDIRLRGILRVHHLRGADELAHINAHRVELVDEDLIDLKLRLQLVLSLIIFLHRDTTTGIDFTSLLRSATAGALQRASVDFSSLLRYIAHLLLQELNLSLLPLLRQHHLLALGLGALKFLLARTMRLSQFLDVLSLLLVLLGQQLHLLPLNDQLVLESSILGRIYSWLGFFTHQHVAQADDLV